MTQQNSQNTDNFRVFNYWGEDLLQVIDVLNELIYDEKNQYRERFSLLIDGHYIVIQFGSVCLWCSDEDDREFYEQTNRYEPMFPFIQRKFNAYVEDLYSLHFKSKEDILSERNTVSNIPEELKQYPFAPKDTLREYKIGDKITCLISNSIGEITEFMPPDPKMDNPRVRVKFKVILPGDPNHYTGEIRFADFADIELYNPQS